MSLIIAYIGKKGCVMASDKRRIAYLGNKDNLKILEDELHNGTISNLDELKNRSNELNVALNISENANKIRTVGNSIVGEVRTKGSFETKRKRIYGTSNAYQVVELVGSNITFNEKGEKAVILFGNKYTKKLAGELINKKWKASQSLRYIGEIFEEILKEVSKKTASIGDSFDVLIKNKEYTPEEAQSHLDEIIKRDVKILSKIREDMKNTNFKINKKIKHIGNILIEGEVGEVISKDDNILVIELNSTTQAFDKNWKIRAKPNGEVLMFTESKNVEIGDKVIIKDKKLCLEKDKSNLRCDIILCGL